MKHVLLCAALAALAAPAFADDLVAREGRNEIRLAAAPCASQTVQALLSVQSPNYQAASATVDGQKFEGCWRKVGDVVHVVYEDGDQGIIPVADLKNAISV